MRDTEVTERDGKTSPTPGDTWVGPLYGDAGSAPALPEDLPVDNEVGDGEVPTESGGKSAEVTMEPSMASPRLIPVPGSPTNSGRLDPTPILEDSGNSSVSSRQKCAPSPGPER